MTDEQLRQHYTTVHTRIKLDHFFPVSRQYANNNPENCDWASRIWDNQIKAYQELKSLEMEFKKRKLNRINLNP